MGVFVEPGGEGPTSVSGIGRPSDAMRWGEIVSDEDEEPALGMETRKFETDQFAITRVKWLKFSCDPTERDHEP